MLRLFRENIAMASYYRDPSGFVKEYHHVNYNSNDKDMEPFDHKLARENVMSWYERKNKYIAYGNKPIQFPPSFIAKHKLKYEIHEYDVWVYDSRIAITKFVLEIDQKENDTVTLPTGSKLEVTQSRHNTPTQIIKDQIAEDYIHEYYPNVKFMRIQKTDCFFPKKLNKILSEFSK